MKNILLFILLWSLSFGLSGQEMREGDRHIPALGHTESTKEIAAELFPLTIDNTPSGPFSYERYAVPINLMDINLYSNEQNELDILALSRAKENYKKSQIRSVNTERQLQQIRAQVQVFANQDQKFNTNQDIYNRANNNLNYDKRTPDGGIRNEALRDIRQPFMRPHYYDYYRPGYYYSPYRPTSSFHLYRR